MPIDRARIQEYLRQGEGAPPPVFVGHDGILDDILLAARESAGQPKMTRVVQGAPGAGKSSLLHWMQKRWTEKEGMPRVVALSSTDIMDEPAVGVGAVLDAWAMDEAKWRRTLTERLKRLSGFGIGSGGLSVEFADAEVPKTLRMVANVEPKREQAGPIVVAVDEAQRLTRGQTAPEARFLQSIHDGTSGLAIGLVLAGLSDTDARADEMHLTRGRTVHEARPLTEFQARDFMRRLALYFGLDTSRHNPQLQALADICDGWPRHLRYAGVSLAEEALRVDGDMHRMDWPAMASKAWTLRQKYYQDQSRGMMQDADILVAKVMSGLRDGMKFRELRDLVNDLIRDSSERLLPENVNATAFLNELIHQGALYRNTDGCVHSPIPSFRSFLIDQGRQPDTEPARRNDGGGDGTDSRF